MALYIKIPKDINKIKDKAVWKLTKRQVVIFGIGFAVYWLTYKSLGMQTAAIYDDKSVFKLEKVIVNIIRHNICPKIRPYKTENVYRQINEAIEYNEQLIGIQKDVIRCFTDMGVAAVPLNGEERLFAMYKILHQYSDEPFICDFDTMPESGFTPKDYIAPSSLNFSQKDNFKCGNFYGATFSVNLLASEISDRFLISLMNTDNPIAFNMHFTAIDSIEAKKYVKKKLSNIESSKVDEQQKAVQNGYDIDILPPDMKTYINELNILLDDLENKNERMFLTTILVTNFAKSGKKLSVCNDRLNRMVLQANSKLISLDHCRIWDFLQFSLLPKTELKLKDGLLQVQRQYFFPFPQRRFSWTVKLYITALIRFRGIYL